MKKLTKNCALALILASALTSVQAFSGSTTTNMMITTSISSTGSLSFSNTGLLSSTTDALSGYTGLASVTQATPTMLYASTNTPGGQLSIAVNQVANATTGYLAANPSTGVTIPYSIYLSNSSSSCTGLQAFTTRTNIAAGNTSYPICVTLSALTPSGTLAPSGSYDSTIGNYPVTFTLQY